MKSNVKLLNIWVVVFSIFLLISCNSDDNTINNPQGPTINIEEAKLSDFPLFGIRPTAIEIVDPEIVDNKEIKYGEIKITLPSTITSLENISVSITSAELNLSKFSISPGNNVLLSFEDQKVHVFTISAATGDKEELIHYNVSIVKEAPVIPETLKITGFTFEKSKNPSLPNDITISRYIEDDGFPDKIYLFVPLKTDFTDLVPTITYDGAKLYYDQGSNSYAEYPTIDTSFDFKYPKPFYLKVKNKNDNRERTATIIVDVVNPVRLEKVSVTTPDVTKGSTSVFFTGMTKWINQGNHKINFQRATTYEEMNPVIISSVTNSPVNVITTDRNLPSGGLEPGESANVNVSVNSRFPEDLYTTTAVFYTRIYGDRNVDDLIEPAKLKITSKIIK